MRPTPSCTSHLVPVLSSMSHHLPSYECLAPKDRSCAQQSDDDMDVANRIRPESQLVIASPKSDAQYPCMMLRPSDKISVSS